VTTLILLDINLVIAVMFGLLAARSSLSRAERKAVQVRQQPLDPARGASHLLPLFRSGTSFCATGTATADRSFADSGLDSGVAGHGLPLPIWTFQASTPCNKSASSASAVSALEAAWDHTGRKHCVSTTCTNPILDHLRVR
jgi:hypothetical protein